MAEASPFAIYIQGVHHTWNNKFDEAEQLFVGSKDTECRAALHYAEPVFIKSFISGDLQDTQAAMARLQACRTLAQSQIKALEAQMKAKDNAARPSSSANLNLSLQNRLLDARLVFGDSLYMIAVLQITQNEKIKGAFNLRKSWKVFEKALKLSKTIPDLDEELKKSLQFGAGFFLFAISILPKQHLKLVEMVGFKADREGGLAYVRDCHSKGGLRAPFATMVLLFNNLLLPRGLADANQYLQEANKLIEESSEVYPTGSLFQVMGSHCARKQCDVDKGIMYMQKALDSCKMLKRPPFTYQYELGNCYCMKMDWKAAANTFSSLVEEEKFQARIICAIQLACCYVQLDEYDKAVELFKRVQNFPGRKSQFDPIIIRQAQRYLANGGHFAAFELLYLRRDLAKMIPVMNDVLKALDLKAAKTKALEKKEAAPPKSASEKLGSKFGKLSPFNKKKQDTDYSFDDRAAYLLLKGSMLKAVNKNDEAISCFREALDLADSLVEKLYIPYGCYELGESYYIKGDLQQAEEYMKRCSKITGYDWEDPLKVRLRVTMDQLKKGTQPATQDTKPPSLDALTLSDSVDGKDDEEDDKDDD